MNAGTKSSLDCRIGYLNAVNKFQELKYNIGSPESNIILSQGFLQFEQILTHEATQLQFPILENQNVPGGGTQSRTEVRLNLQDAFFVNEIIVYLSARSTPEDGFRNAIMTFPSAWYFGGAAGGVQTDKQYQMMAPWQGYLTYTINQQLVIPKWDCSRHLYIPETQVLNYNPPLPNEYFTDLDEYNGALQGWYPMEPNIILWGSANNVLTLTMPWSTGECWNYSTTEMRVCVRVRGILAQNCTSVNINDYPWQKIATAQPAI